RRAAPGAWHRVGLPATCRGRAALVPPLSRRTDDAVRSAALDTPGAELESRMRGVSLDEPAQALRRRVAHLRHDVGRAERGVRGLSRPGLPTCCLGARRAPVQP